MWIQFRVIQLLPLRFNITAVKSVGVVQMIDLQFHVQEKTWNLQDLFVVKNQQNINKSLIFPKSSWSLGWGSGANNIVSFTPFWAAGPETPRHSTPLAPWTARHVPAQNGPGIKSPFSFELKKNILEILPFKQALLNLKILRKKNCRLVRGERTIRSGHEVKTDVLQRSWRGGFLKHPALEASNSDTSNVASLKLIQTFLKNAGATNWKEAKDIPLLQRFWSNSERQSSVTKL